MRKRLTSICIIVMLILSIFGCADTAEETPVAETETVETDHIETVSEEETEFVTDVAEQEGQTTDNPVPQEEPEPEEEIGFDGSDTHLSILTEYERAWEDETYTVEEWQDVAGVFMTLSDPKLNAEDYTLYYSISDLSGDGTEELIIGVQGEDGIAPCFLYTDGGERIHMTSSRAESDLVNIPTILYENGIIESTDYVKNKYGIHRYNFYQLLKESGKMKLIDLYFYTKDSENGTQYYKGDISNPVTEEEFWDGINDYESLPQIELDWNELKDFWKPGKDDAKTSASGEEHHGQSEKAEEAESKCDEPVTVIAKETAYYSDGSFKRQEEYEYDSAGNRIKIIYFNDFDSIYEWYEYEYDSAGNKMKGIGYNAEGSIAGWWEYEYEYDSAGNKVKCIEHDADGSSYIRWEKEYDSAGNEVKYISIRYGTDGSVLYWYEYEYDSVGNTVKLIRCDADGSVEWVHEYKYDSAGNEVKCIAYDADGNSYIWWEMEYDSAGNEMWYINYNADGSVRYWEEYEYDSAGNEVKSIEYGVSGNSWYEFGYDNAGNRTSYIGYSISSNIHIWEEFEYDNAGNWTKAIDCKTGQWTEREYITITPQ